MGVPFLVADIGGTNARFAMAHFTPGATTLEHRQSFRAEDFEHIADAVRAYLESWSGEKPKTAVFAVAAALNDRTINFTNSPWTFTIDELRGSLRLERLGAMNDFEAQALGVHDLGTDSFRVLKPGTPDPKAPCAVFGPGTGLGLSIVVPTAQDPIIIPTEGGHSAFAPGNEKEIEVLKFIRAEHEFVSYERLLSGRGLVNIHRALCVIAGQTRVSLTPSEITEAAKAKTLPIAVEAVDMFCAILGGYAGDVAVMTGARGGSYVAGGIAPRIVDILAESAFVERFCDRGPMTEYMTDIPVNAVMTDEAAFFGAARRAMELEK